MIHLHNCIDEFLAPTHAMRVLDIARVAAALMETHMKTTMIALLLLSLALTGCIVAPGPGYGGPGYTVVLPITAAVTPGSTASMDMGIARVGCRLLRLTRPRGASPSNGGAVRE